MDGHVASGASLIMGIGHAMRGVVWISDAAVRSHPEIAVAGVTLQAKLRDGRPGQQFGVRRAVRPVAGYAAVLLPRFVLKHKWTPLFDVALQTGLIAAV